MAIKSHEEGDLEIDCADFGFDTDCTGNVARSNELYVKGIPRDLIGLAVFVFVLVVEHGEVGLVAALGDVVVFYGFDYGTAGFVGVGAVGEAALLGELEDFLEIAGQLFAFHIEGSEALYSRSID